MKQKKDDEGVISGHAMAILGAGSKKTKKKSYDDSSSEEEEYNKKGGTKKESNECKPECKALKVEFTKIKEQSKKDIMERVQKIEKAHHVQLKTVRNLAV